MVDEIQGPGTLFSGVVGIVEPGGTSRLHAMVDPRGYCDKKQGSGGRLDETQSLGRGGDLFVVSQGLGTVLACADDISAD